MQMSDLRFRIKQEQHGQMVAIQMALLVTLFSVVTAAVGPQLLYEYLLKNADVNQQVMVLQYVPLATYGIATLFFVFALVRWLSGVRRVRMIEQEIALMTYSSLYTDEAGDEDMDSQLQVEPVRAARKTRTAKKTVRAKRK